MATRREVIRFEAEPVKVTLDKGPHAGIECRGQYGIDWRYSVNHGKGVMYLPAEAREALFESGALEGEEVAIRRLGKTRWKRNESPLIFRFLRNPRLGKRRKQTSRYAQLRQHLDYRNGYSHLPNRRLLPNRHPHPNPFHRRPLPRGWLRRRLSSI